MQCKHSTMVFISGLVWLGVGLFLMPLGVSLLLSTLGIDHTTDRSYPLIQSLSPLAGGLEQTVLILLCLGLLIGFFKGRFVLGKSAKKGIERIRQFSNPTPLSNLYSLKYFILILGMIGLGIGIKWAGISNDVRGLIDVAIGAALINGAVIYFRSAFALRKLENN